MTRLIAILICFVVVAWPAAAQAERRVALVIGNSAYDAIGALKNPANDAHLIGRPLLMSGSIGHLGLVPD